MRVAGNVAALDGAHQRFERAALQVDVAAADQHAVAAGANRLDRRLRHGVLRAHRLHLEIVAQDHAVELQLVAQQRLDDVGRQRRRPLLVERRHQHVRGHDERDLLGDRGAERLELDRAQAIGRMLDERQLEVRVGAGVAVAGKMLAAGGQAGALQRRG